jgi:hypothetical protein
MAMSVISNFTMTTLMPCQFGHAFTTRRPATNTNGVKIDWQWGINVAAGLHGNNP